MTGATTFSQSNLKGIFFFRITPPCPGPSNVRQLYPLCKAGAAANVYSSSKVESNPPCTINVGLLFLFSSMVYMCPGSDVPSYGISIDSTAKEKSSAALLKHSLLLPQDS